MLQNIVINFNLRKFDAVINTTGTSTLSAELQTYYDKVLIAFARPSLVHDNWAQKKDIPKNGGKTIEFRKFSPLSKATTPLTEGVTPDGKQMTVTALTATVDQYGDYIKTTDMLQLTSKDPIIVEATKMIADQAGRTLDTISREVMNAGSNVQYQENAVTARYLLVGGESSGNHYMTVKTVKQAVRNLKTGLAKKVDGKNYAAIIHVDVAYDLTEDSDWKAPHQYVDTKNIYSGEIGMLHGVRFAETTEAKIFHADDLVATGGDNDARTLTVASYESKVITIDEALSAADALALADRKIIVDGYQYTVTEAAAGAAGAATITIEETPTHNPADGDVVYPGEAGAKGRDIYSTLFLGAGAYGTTKVTGGGLQTIVKPLGAGEDPLNQRSTIGWKAIKVTERLVETYMVRVETASNFASGAN